MHNLRDKLIKVHDRLQQAAKTANRDPRSIQLLAVSKTQPTASIRELFQLGQVKFGENYLQEAVEKQRQLTDLAIEWHFIGPIQSNKTQLIAEHFSWVHSVDRVKIAERLNIQRPGHLPPLDICVQLNVDDEHTKSGVSAHELDALIAALLDLPRLRLRGLMAIPAPRTEFNEQLAVFKHVQHVFNQLQTTFPALAMDTLSMGMSADLEAAIAAGATIVRVGTDLFGARPPPSPG